MLFLFQHSVEVIDGLAKQVITGVAAEDAMVAVSIYQLTEIFVGLHKSLDIFCRILIMYVVIGQTMTNEERSM
jgi:hypothetical protein